MVAVSTLILLVGIYLIYHCIKGDTQNKRTVLTTDMELYIAQLEIKPKSNKDIKNVARYLESTIMPNEKIIAVAYAYIFAIATDKRIIIKSLTSSYTNIIPIEKITSVTQNGSRVYINQNWVNLSTIELATKFTNIVNNQVSSFQTVGQSIKIENKIVTEETITSQLQKLSDLHEAGVLTDYEYSIKKQELLDKMK